VSPLATGGPDALTIGLRALEKPRTCQNLMMPVVTKLDGLWRAVRAAHNALSSLVKDRLTPVATAAGGWKVSQPVFQMK
jgi:hypothetical protein